MSRFVNERTGNPAGLVDLYGMRNAAADGILELRQKVAAKGGRMEAREQDQFDELQTRYDALGEEIDKLTAGESGDKRASEVEGLQRRREENDRFDRDSDGPGDRRSDDRDTNGVSASDVDLAVAGWARNAFGIPVPAEEAAAIARRGTAPASSGFEFKLNRSRPTIGHQLRFAGPRNVQARAMSRVPFASGGATVPEGFVNRLEIAMKSFSPMMETSEVWISDDGRPAAWPTLDDTSQEGTQIGEGQLVPNTDLTVGAYEFRPYKFTSGLIKASHELLRDSAVNLAGEIGNALGIRLGRAVNTKATTGNGAATIRGILEDATLGVTAAGAAAITGDEIIDLAASVDPAYSTGPGVGFMMSQSVYAAVLKLKTSDGAYLFSFDKSQADQRPMLRGYPVYINQAMPSLATGNKTILFGQLSKYKLRIVVGVRIRILAERYADTDQTGIVGFIEADGALLDAGTHPVKYLQQA